MLRDDEILTHPVVDHHSETETVPYPLKRKDLALNQA